MPVKDQHPKDMLDDCLAEIRLRRRRILASPSLELSKGKGGGLTEDMDLEIGAWVVSDGELLRVIL